MRHRSIVARPTSNTMTSVTYLWNQVPITKKVRDPSFILTNNEGSFVHLGNKPSSKFQGVFLSHKRHVYKFLDSIEVKGDVHSLQNNFSDVVRHRELMSEIFYMPSHHHSLCYETSEKSTLTITMDCRRDVDFRNYGRFYNIYENDNAIVIEFTKKTDQREDRSHDEEEYKLYLAIVTDGSHRAGGNWINRNYEDDAKRNSSADRWVYEALTITGTRTVFGMSTTEHGAISDAHYCFAQLDTLREHQRNHLPIVDNLPELAARTAMNSLVTNLGIYAGLPWFYQYWNRDQLIALSGAHPYIQKHIIMRCMRSVNHNGRLVNVSGSQYTDTGLGSSDSIGWLFFRASELHSQRIFNLTDVGEITETLRRSLKEQQQHYGRDGFIYSGPNETWMDTSFNDYGREGFPIEIQALTLASYNFLSQLTKDSAIKKQELRMARLVRQHFWDGNNIADVLGHPETRPNFFIAAYVYPKLLTKKEWERAIQNALPRLWLGWGGLSSLMKDDLNFHPNYTGENNQSYHRGDSWYWINNLAAIVMHRVNPTLFRPYIEKIREASVRDLLWNGSIGTCSEVSSASRPTSSGCLNQAWSDSTLLELFKELDSSNNS